MVAVSLMPPVDQCASCEGKRAAGPRHRCGARGGSLGQAGPGRGCSAVAGISAASWRGWCRDQASRYCRPASFVAWPRRSGLPWHIGNQPEPWRCQSRAEATSGASLRCNTEPGFQSVTAETSRF